jgi:hypothetical protein
LKLEERLGDIIWYVEVHGASWVIPVDGDAAEECTVPIHGDPVVFLKTLFEMGEMIARCWFDPKAVDDEAEGDVAPYMSPETTGCVGNGSIHGYWDVIFVGEDACLREAVHAHSYFYINPTLVIDLIKEIVASDDFVGDKVEAEAHVFVVGHGSHEVEIWEVHAVEFCVGIGNGGIDEEFGGDEIGHWSALVAIICDAVATEGESCVMWFLFLWSIIADNAFLCCVLVLRYLFVMNE